MIPHRSASLAILLALALAATARAGAPPSLTGMRTWSAPTSTRVVFDLSAPAALVAPDSGRAVALVVRIPETVTFAPGVARSLSVRDGVVDSVAAGVGPAGATFRVWLRDTSRFSVFTLRPEQDKPFRIVVDVARPGAAAAEDRALAGIAAAKKQQRVRVVAIDAGHGGEDTGARGSRGVQEKRANLAIALALAEKLNQTPGIRAVLTRDGDYFIPLRERYRIAEKAHADLFISIHANSTPRRGSGSGTEVYFLSIRGASDQATKDLADKENAADLVGGVPEQAEDDLVSILYDVKRSSALQQSQLLAETLLDRVTKDRRLQQRGVKQAGFVVLKSVEFPSVLVETAFINNAVEARLLMDPDFQKQIADELAQGVLAYLDRSRLGYDAGADTARGSAR
jgi:N-acetylmuramoyl-L-alanine amidase